ncbi:hypothetical protein KOAAANKH_01382 [Brevundimonas sp. NIBR10]|uniref:winged helix-turn-helix domain-containing protein n=1 Tax=Brevundimonas sp. NIBR10 TaxID=3015997 RepID=UPI0022F179F1|nr:transcriptional regulator [Brevundimonas sp. NIBR10]WGM46512.1 hypothetical protein KOAAANKH_01382 [Brevundimonas sp. NIBR10]
MADGTYRFDRFVLEPQDRRLTRDGEMVELSGRYFDALVLLVSEPGRLVTKARFMDEVWRGVPVTDEALTQCIRSLRRVLGDDVSNPRFIETAPKHGYRFIALVMREDGAAAASVQAIAAAGTAVADATEPTSRGVWDTVFRLGRGGMLGGGAAGLMGGLVYGFAGVAGGSEGGGASALLVVAVLTMAVGLMGGAGVGFGIAAAEFAPGRRGIWGVVGGAVGGLVVGAVVKLVGLDAFTLLFGQSPGGITGAPEGALLGGAVGLGASLANGAAAKFLRPVRIAVAGLLAAAAGVTIVLLGGRLMGGSLQLLAERFSQSRLTLDHLGGLFGESGFGLISQSVTAGLEGGLFGACVVAALMVVRRSLRTGGR